MITRPVIQVVAGIVVIVFALGILLTGGTVQAEWLRFYSIAVLVAVSAMALWERFLWHTSLAQQLPFVPRDLRGTWRGTLESFWKDPNTGQSPPPKTAYLVVRQTFGNIRIVLLTNESRSVSSLSRVTEDDSTASLDYMYLNRPDSRLEHRSRMHHGSTSLDITGRPPTRLRGRYWTNRDTRGELDFAARRSPLAEDYAQAEALFAPENATSS
jgi:hypothetical protein